ncbi:ABC transporter substrate-binding protein [Paraherbaspirillum soli]|uniref:ABC transporter substrate-binding protein n=1 Tax=Paraherbaspirillum soli TaxID=631222 RepID=A0ABW0M9J9_9BURK
MQVKVKSVFLGFLFSVFCLPVLAEEGVTATEIKLGQSTYLTGAMAELGNDFKVGAELYFNEVNQAGGVFGRRIQLTTLDDAYDPKRALDNAKQLQQSGVFALFQFAGTGSVLAVAPFAAAQKIPLVAAIATGPKLRASLNPYTFYVRPGNSEEYEGIVKNLATIGVKNVAIVYIDEAYGEEGLDAITSIMKKYQLKPYVAASLKKNGDGAEAAVKTIIEKAPQAIILVTLPQSTKAFMQSYAKSRPVTQIYTPSAGLPPGLIKELGTSASGIAMTRGMPYEMNDTVRIVKEYQTAAKRANLAGFTGNQLEGYLNAKVLVEALHRAGKNLTREGLVQALESMSAYDAGGFSVKFSKTNHAASSSIDLVVVGKSGRIIY